jgi:autophagy-related protein 2
MLDGLPLRLQSGSIGSVIVRIPWPNLLTSKLGLSLKSVHVALELVESSESAPSADLAESLASLSESFVHDELGQEEEEDLLRSMHSGSVDEGHLPGGFQDPATAGPSVGHMQSDEAGMFSALVERLVARFSLDASDIRITIAKPDITRFTFHVADIRYGQDAKAESSEDRDSIVDGQQPREPSFTQSLSIYGFQLSMASLRLISSSSETQSSSNPSRIAGPSSATTAARHEHPSPSPPGSTSGSEFDDEAAAHMSQSLFFPRRGSPPEDMERSVYESAVLDPLVPSPVEDLTQEVVPAVNMPPDDPAELSHPESGHVILSLPEPIQATISLHYRRDGSSDESVQGPYSRRLLSISISLGIIPLALKSAHIRDLLEVTSFASAQSTTAPQSRREASSVPSVLKPRVEFNGHVRGVAIILLPEDVLDDTDSIHPVSDFFLHPQHVPAIQPVFTRLFVDGIDLSFTQHTQAAKFGSLSKVARHEVVTAISVEVVDASLLCFYETGSPSSYVQPIFITDTNLSQQYSPYHHHPPLPGSGGDIESRKLPSFDVIDWADPARRTSSAKLSTWRVRPSPPSHQRSGFGLSNVGLSTSPPTNVGLDMHMMHRIHGGLSPTQRAISASMHASTSFAASMISESTSITMSILPVHVFIDLGVVEDSTAAGQDSRLLAFIDGCLGDIPSITQPPDDFTAPPLAESQQLRKRALNDLDLKYDYDQPPVRDADNLKVTIDFRSCCLNSDT